MRLEIMIGDLLRPREITTTGEVATVEVRTPGVTLLVVMITEAGMILEGTILAGTIPEEMILDEMILAGTILAGTILAETITDVMTELPDETTIETGAHLEGRSEIDTMIDTIGHPQLNLVGQPRCFVASVSLTSAQVRDETIARCTQN